MADPIPTNDGLPPASAVIPPMPSQTPNKVIVKGNIVQHVTHIEKSSSAAQDAFKSLHDQICVAAYENSDEHDEMKCFPGTRTSLLQLLEEWTVIPANERRPMVWLDGPMGAGKTAVARSIAERVSRREKLLGIFIFRRGEPYRNNASRFITTLSYQIALSIPLARPYIEQQIIHDPSIFQQSLSRQLQALVINPLQNIRTHHPDLDPITLPNVLIVDGLDECGGDIQGDQRKKEMQIAVLDLLHRLVQRSDILPFAILVHSRPERQIKNWFTIDQHRHITYRATLAASYDSDRDIELFVKHSFLMILACHPSRYSLPPNWPLDTSPKKLNPHEHPTATWPVVEEIVRKSSGHFIYASIVMKYVASPYHEPNKRLNDILSSGNAGGNSSDSPVTILDALFHQILEAAGDRYNTMQILCYNSISTTFRNRSVGSDGTVYGYFGSALDPYIFDILGISQQEFDTWMAHMAPLLERERCYAYSHFLRFHHTSFSEFLNSKERAKHWTIDPWLCLRFIVRFASKALK
ncbi:hypothetical protein CVT24_009479 [Panaeolus cyanescens]|uniref:Nephrocystin 3-like N-terminal domain-containing protein n=1 Tax=Panaeolus cyanescens TaxID=181874 RepID=A0A409WEP3_9AGAR|nr:hypothetical protein CVT24_009479 [Panaeolus cyanescens]